MFDYLTGAGQELHAEILKMYWVLMVPLILLLLVWEVIKGENPDIVGLFRRVLISILLLYTFDWTLDALATMGDAITDKINGLEKLADVLKHLGPNYSGGGNWFSLRETTIYIFNLVAYIVAYLGFFVATVLTHFVWTILYVCSPLMILMYVTPQTSFVTSSLYKGLVNVVLWKILWSILGVLLLKLAIQPEVSGLDDYLMSIVVNLCIGICMLFIPLATKSLISDGMGSVANTLAMAPTIAAAGVVKGAASHYTGKAAGHIKDAGRFIGKPVSNQLSGRLEQFKDWSRPVASKVDGYKKRYETIGIPKYVREKQERNKE